jgi:hypothetical protein
MVFPNQLINKVKWRSHNVGSEEVSLNDHSFGLHPSLAGSYAFFCPLTDFVQRTASRHSSTKNIQKVAKNNTNEILLVQK